MILRAEYRSLAEAAAAAGLVIEAGVMLHDRLALALVVHVPPFRFAPIVATYPPGQWLLRGAGESLEDYARRVEKEYHPVIEAMMRAGIVPVSVWGAECCAAAPDVIKLLQTLRSTLLCVPQGMAPAGVLTEVQTTARELAA